MRPLTDSFGRIIDFKNVILIMTSNIGADLIKNQSGFGFGKKSPESNFEKMKDEAGGVAPQVPLSDQRGLVSRLP